jgi:hypothetical protein
MRGGASPFSTNEFSVLNVCCRLVEDPVRHLEVHPPALRRVRVDVVEVLEVRRVLQVAEDRQAVQPAAPLRPRERLQRQVGGAAAPASAERRRAG